MSLKTSKILRQQVVQGQSTLPANHYFSKISRSAPRRDNCHRFNTRNMCSLPGNVFDDHKFECFNSSNFLSSSASRKLKSGSRGSPTHSPERPGADRRANNCCENIVHPSTKICQTPANSGASTACGRGTPTKFPDRVPELHFDNSLRRLLSYIENELQDWSMFRFKTSNGSNAMDSKSRDAKFSRRSSEIVIDFWTTISEHRDA